MLKQSQYIVNLFLMIVFVTVVGLIFMQKKQGKEAYANGSFDLVDPKRLAVIQGVTSTFPMKKLEFDEDPSKPSVDGTHDGPKSLFTFAFNKASPACCGTDNSAGYSSSAGCICITDNQKKYFQESSKSANIGCMY